MTITKYLSKQLSKLNLKDPNVILAVYLLFGIFVSLLFYGSFWLFVWSVKALFKYDIPLDSLHFLAFMVFTGSFKTLNYE
jgi:hypothetical protein